MSLAEAVSVSREALGALAPLFAWPDESYLRLVEEARVPVARADRRAARDLDAFAEAVAALTAAERETTYTSTFDLAPCCSPYLGVQLFGDDNRDRARLMVGLRMSFTAGGHDLGGELPDHVAVVLSFATRFPEEEWSDLVRLVLLPAAERMEALLAKSSNPFRHLISTTRRLCRAALEEGGRA